MESEVKSFLSEKNIGNECLLDLTNFGEFFFFNPIFKGEFCFENESGPLTSCSFNINWFVFFLKESKNKSTL